MLGTTKLTITLGPKSFLTLNKITARLLSLSKVKKESGWVGRKALAPKPKRQAFSRSGFRECRNRGPSKTHALSHGQRRSSRCADVTQHFVAEPPPDDPLRRFNKAMKLSYRGLLLASRSPCRHPNHSGRFLHSFRILQNPWFQTCPCLRSCHQTFLYP